MITAIIIKLPVTRAGQMSFFDLNIPSDASLVIDMGTAVMGMQLPPQADLKGHNVAGALTLQSNGAADMCYSSVVTFAASPVEAGLPGIEMVNSSLTSLFSAPYYENDYRRIPSAGSVESYTLYGCYEDIIGKELNGSISYYISLCIWLKTGELKQEL